MFGWFFKWGKTPAITPAPEASAMGMVGGDVVAVNTPAGLPVNVSGHRINARLARIEQGISDAHARRAERNDPSMDGKIAQFEAERTILQAQKVLRGL